MYWILIYIKDKGIVFDLASLDCTNIDIPISDEGSHMGIENINRAVKKLEEMGAASVRIATMLFKPEAFKFDYKIDYIGMNIGNEFIVGYGLDYNEHGRNYPSIYKIVEEN